MSRNPYHTEEQVPTLRDSVFVYMDILGYSDMIRESEELGTQQEVLSRLHTTLSKEREWLEDKMSPKELRALIKKDSYALKAFTDNIVIGWPIRDDGESKFWSAFSKLGIFQLQMVTSGFFIRGAISVDNAYVDEITVFGKALTEACIGESSLAVNPRIIFTASAMKVAREHLTHYSEPRHAPHTRDILQDSDGQWFLNYLDCILIAENEQGPYYNEFLKHKAIVEQMLQQHRGNPSIWSKYAWVAGYHNYFSDLHSEYFNDDYKINVELFRASPTLIV